MLGNLYLYLAYRMKQKCFGISQRDMYISYI